MSILRLTVQHTYGSPGGPGVNVWHYRTATDIVDATDLTQASDALDDFYGRITGRFPTASSLTLLEQAIDIETSEVYSAPVWTRSGSASSSQSYLPTAAAICLNWRTTNASRSGRGRTFIGPLGAGNLDTDGTPSLQARNQISDSGTQLIQALAGSGDGAFGVWSPTQSLFRDFVSCYTRDQFAVLRSRRD